jgi:hypothetical protein
LIFQNAKIQKKNDKLGVYVEKFDV